MTDRAKLHQAGVFATAGAKIAQELRLGVDPASTEGIYLEMLRTYFQWAATRVKALEEL